MIQKKFTIWGTFVESLTKVLLAAATEAHQNHYGTPRYYVQRNLALHRAFQKLADEHYLDAASVYRELYRYFKNGYISSGKLMYRDLLLSLPDEFNVRGVWTPET